MNTTLFDGLPNLIFLLGATGLKALFLLAAAAIAVRFMRHAPPAARHLAWTAAIGGILLLPVLPLALPEMRLAWTPSWMSAKSERSSPAPETAAFEPRNPPPDLVTEKALPAEREVIDNNSSKSFVLPPNPRETAGAHQSNSTSRFWPWVLWVWLAGALLVLLSMAAAWFRVVRLTSHSSPLQDQEWLDLTDRLAASLGLRRQVQLRKGSNIPLPMTWGAWRPVVLLPAHASGWSQKRRRVVLLHELAHVRRQDWLTQMAAAAACALYWYNPLAWLAAGRMRIEREQACDDLVLRSGPRPSDYAEELLSFAATSTRAARTDWAAVPMARRSSLEGRLAAILDPRRKRGPLTGLSIAASLLALALMVVPISALKIGGDLAEPADSQIEIVLWQAMIGSETFDQLFPAHGFTASSNHYQQLEADGAALLARLRNERLSGGFIRPVAKAVWLQRARHPGLNIFDLTSLWAPQAGMETKDPAGSLVCHGFHRFESKGEAARLELQFTLGASLQRLAENESGYQTAATDPMHQQQKWSGLLPDGRAIAFAARLQGDLGREFIHLMVAQTVRVPKELAAHLGSMTSTERWLTHGPEAVIHEIRQALAWTTGKGSGRAGEPGYQPPSGTPVRLVAISRPERWFNRWWSLEGQPVPSNPAWLRSAPNPAFGVVLNRGHLQGGLAVEIRPRAEATLSGSSGAASGGDFSPGEGVWWLADDDNGSLGASLDSGEGVDLVIKHGVGAWKKIATIQEGETINADGGRFALAKVEAKNPAGLSRPGLILIKADFDYDPKFEIAFVAVNQKGHQTDFVSWNGTGSFERQDGRVIYQHLEIDKSEVAHFTILKRPVKEFIFTNILTRPAVPID